MKHFLFSLTAMLFPMTLLAADAPSAAGLPGLYCGQPQAKVYQEKNINDFLEVTLMADHAALNIYGSKVNAPRSRAVVRVKNSEGVTETFAALLSNRGNSRRGDCQTKPLRLEFVDSKISQEIAAQLEQENISPSDKDYLVHYHSIFMAMDATQANTVAAPSNGFFAKLGDDIKIVTHCGPNSLGLFRASESTQNDRVRGEFTLYKILATLKMPVEATRGANITYLNPDGSSVFLSQNEQGEDVLSRPGFFREPPKSIAKRCGLLNKMPIGVRETFHPDSVDQATFMNNLVLNGDWGSSGHNTNILWNKDGEKFLAVYDFDLSSVLAGGDGWTKTLASHQKNIQFSKYTLKHRDEIKAVIDQAILEPATRDFFNKWFRTEMERLEKVVSP